jgi:uncharacterized membrane protein YidH (DUF202 family)
MAASPDPARPADNGLQRERTTLAWRRTGLALWIGAALLARLTVEAGGRIGILLVAFALALATWAVASTLRREPLATSHDIGSAFDAALPDGRLPAVLSAAAVLLCAAELAVILGS